VTKYDKSKTHLEKHSNLHLRVIDLLGKAINPISNVQMKSRGIYYIYLGWLGFMMRMPKIKEKVTLGGKSKNNNLFHPSGN